MRNLILCSIALLSCLFPALAQQSEPQNPVLRQRPPQQPGTLVIRDGKIKVDAVVTDAAGTAVTDLQPWDFKLTDNGKPGKIQSFRFFDGTLVKPDPPVEVILLMDMINLPFVQVAFVRKEVDSFLRQNNGHLAQPTSLIVFNDSGLHVLPQPTTDGDALANVVGKLHGSIRVMDAAQGAAGRLERLQLSVKQLGTIAVNEGRKPGRKLLIWIGPGWPMLESAANDYYSERDQRLYFRSIVDLSTWLREARMVLYSVQPTELRADNLRHDFIYQSYLKGIKSAREADTGNLALKVLVTETGGLILGPDNDLATQLNRCVADANAFYTLGFDPPKAEHPDEYHDLKIGVDKPGLTVRTTTGYYNQP